MSDKRYIQKGMDKALSHAIEEAGEFLTAAGKLQRWGSHSNNPIYDEAPDGSRRECNAHWLWREAGDLLASLTRLRHEMAKEHDEGFFEQNKKGEFLWD